MWKPDKRCTVCRLILGGDSDLKKRIYQSTRFLPDGGGESLTDIFTSYGGNRTKTSSTAGVFTYLSLANHCKKHQTLDTAKRIAMDPVALQAAKPAPVAVVESLQPEEIYQETMKQGLEALKNGELKLTARDVLRAATDKANIDLKKKDQEFKLAEMVYHFASGEATNAAQYDRRIIEGEAPTTYDAADLTARNLE